MGTRLETANQYIANNKMKVSRRPRFHFSPEIGWMNDPNGFIYYEGKYHLFYQYYPYDIVWNDMHWGHATTSNFVDWEYLPVALANDKLYDANGCFSGTAIEKDGQLYLMYTGHLDANMGYDRVESEVVEQQCVAISVDGIQFEKYEHNPVIAKADLPPGYIASDFRDPKTFKHGDMYYCVIAVRNPQRRGEVIMYRSTDLLSWQFNSIVYATAYEDHTLLECPDFFFLDGKAVLIVSIMPCDPSYAGQVKHETVALVGEMDFNTGVFNEETRFPLDKGRSFYAPQTTEGRNGERILIAWMNSWSHTKPPAHYGYNGMMTIPRQLQLVERQLTFRPMIDLEQQIAESVQKQDVVISATEPFRMETGEAYRLQLALPASNTDVIIELLKTDEQSDSKSARITINAARTLLTFEADYEGMGAFEISLSDYEILDQKQLLLDIFVDLHSIELFVGDGQIVASVVSYEDHKGQSLQLCSEQSSTITTLSWSAFN